MENIRVAVKSMINAQVGINVPDIRLKRDWAKKGSTQFINFEDLQQAIYDPGVEYMFKTGILYIEDMKVKIELGLEPPEATAPTNVIVLDDAQKKRYLTVAPIHELKAVMKQLSHDQLVDFAHFAIELEINDLARGELLKAETGIDVVKAILVNRESAALEKADAAAKP